MVIINQNDVYTFPNVELFFAYFHDDYVSIFAAIIMNSRGNNFSLRFWLRGYSMVSWGGSNQAQNDREENKAVVEAKDNNEKKYFEECG